MKPEATFYLRGIIMYFVLFFIIIAVIEYAGLNSGNVAIGMLLIGFMSGVIKEAIRDAKSKQNL